jgi:hypothetical protein
VILNERHYAHFKAASLNPNIWHGNSPASWFSWIQHHKDVNYSPYLASRALPDQKVSRADLFAIVEDSNVDTLSCCISILAWGGMNRKYGAEALSMYYNWIHVAEDIRKGLLDRGQAYEKFASLREKSLIRGMGPAYFTKLIFFLSPNTLQRGFIMDQWTSTSVNLLFDRKIIETQLQKTRQKNGKFKLSEFVTDKNTKENYLNFCKCVELIATRLSKDPATIEEMLFSEGRGKINWRKYVVDQRSFECK